MQYLSISAAIGDERRYVPEWLEYHRLHGVEQFYLYDNSPRMNLAAQLPPAKDVTVVPWPVRTKNWQHGMLQDCLRFGARTVWMGVIDVDEFVVPAVGTTLLGLLKHFEGAGGFVMNWVIYGSSGFQNRPPGLQIESFLRRAPAGFGPNRHVKTFFRGGRAAKFLDAHSAEYKPGFWAVNELGQRVDGHSCDHTEKKVRLHHYFTRSRSEWAEKVARWRGWRRAEEFEIYDRECMLKDGAILRYVPAVKAALAKWPIEALR